MTSYSTKKITSIILPPLFQGAFGIQYKFFLKIMQKQTSVPLGTFDMAVE